MDLTSRQILTSEPIQAARTYGCEVDTLTLSIEQKRLAEERIRAAGLEKRVRVHLLDYREIPEEFEKAFDAFVSVEMLEVRPIIRYLNPRFPVLTQSFSARRCQALQPLLQTCRLCSEVQGLHCRGHCLNIPRVEVLKLPVRPSFSWPLLPSD